MQINPDPDLSQIGGKAYQLYRLEQLCAVPPFFAVKFDSPSEIDDSAVQAAIADYCRSHNFTSIAVRSSATVEDSVEASYAGMFETVLNVRPDAVADAVKQVLGSVSSQRLKDYCETVGVPPEEIRMAVVIQQMVNSRVAGVCFTKFRAEDDSIIIEACYGLGEALVSGKVTPDTYIVDRNTGSIKHEVVSYQKIFLSNEKEIGTIYQQVPFFKRNARKLSDSEIASIAKSCIVLEQQLAITPLDIEWAYEGDVLYILQARPYTGLPR